MTNSEAATPAAVASAPQWKASSEKTTVASSHTIRALTILAASSGLYPGTAASLCMGREQRVVEAGQHRTRSPPQAAACARFRPFRGAFQNLRDDSGEISDHPGIGFRPPLNTSPN
ncbi:hypothetical protein, partial [Cupriavidus taiwanensis]|uniref:hypothetical protein n=1 Tax=Cupriavidus taiwanensis TaxID=164546 RepID=UPI0039E7C249